jgi:amino acid adenylation domain-containing protein
VQATPSGWKLLLAAGFEERPVVAVTAGEALSPALAGQLRSRVKRLVNGYGPTETTIYSTSWEMAEATDLVPIGRPIANTRTYVLDADLRPVAIGVAGELYIAGHGVARGYVNRPDLTAERFLPEPFGKQPGSRMYRTGDLVRYLPEGDLEFLGRVDHQVKVRGHRIELAEIEARLVAHPDVRDAVVVAREDQAGDTWLVAYLTAVSGPPQPAPLRDFLAATLPTYMVPGAFVVLDALPLTSTGKVDRRALPAPDRAALRQDSAVTPRTPLEERIAAVWSDVLGLEQVGALDSFFDLGGDSIRAVSLVGALRATGLDVTVRDVFAYRTVAGLAEGLATRTAPATPYAPVAPYAMICAEDRAMLPETVVDAYPLSQVQAGMVVEMLADDGQGRYHNVDTYRVRDGQPFALSAMRAAVRVVVARHEMLRTSFDLTTYSVPMQSVHATTEIAVAVRDLRALGEAERTRAVPEFLAAERAGVFDPGRAPLMRVSALVESDEEWWLALTQCHAIVDGWSLRSLVIELVDCYRRIREGSQPVPVEPPAVRYADFVAAELESLAGESDPAYWRGIVDAYPRFLPPAGWGDDPGPPNPGTANRVCLAGVPLHDLIDGLRALASTARVSLKSVLLAAHVKVMSMVTEEPTFHTGLVCNARPEVLGADRVYGMHLNTVPFPVDRGARTWRHLVEQVFAREVELWPHRRLPLPAIQRELSEGRRLLEVGFTFQDFHDVDTDLVEVNPTAGQIANEFALGVTASAQRLVLRADTHRISGSNLERLAGLYQAVLAAMADDPRGDARASYLPEDERARLAPQCSDTAPQPVQRCLHEVFEDRAAATPDAVAIVAGGDVLTYAELNVRANRLAHHLNRLGSGPESVVGVLLEPGIDLLPTLLGVLKSGAAYLPLDLAQPPLRLAYMLADGRASIVVTTAERASMLGADYRGKRVLLDRDAGDLATQPGTDPGLALAPDNLCYLMYTSGSTGRPKGVCVTHANVGRLFSATAPLLSFDATDTCALLHSYAFDVSVWEMWGALLHGGRLVVVPFEVARSPEDLLDLLVRERVSVLSLSPSAFRALAGVALGDDSLPELRLRAVIFGGDKLDGSDLTGWVTRHGLQQPVLAQAYGPTEATVHVTFHVVGPADLDAVGGVPIGRPVPDMRSYVLDRHGHLAPEGVPGEVFVAGAGVARGYGNRPELTAERFLPDPYGPPGARMYRTGDLARVWPDGALDFLGRIDDQVKIRGYRVELGEIQAALVEHPSVREAVVVTDQVGSSERRLVAYYVPAEGDPPSAVDLAVHCGLYLAGYMVPVAFVALDRIPLTTNGKLDRRSLPAVDRGAVRPGREFLPPRTPTERLLADIWSRLLGVAEVGVWDTFFGLGGDSIMILQVVAAGGQVGLAIPLRLLYQDGSLAEVAVAVDAAAAQALPLPALEPRLRSEALPTPLAAMAEHHVAGVSVAVIQGGELVSARGYGVCSAGGLDPVTPDTLFRVASISKHVTAVGVLRLVAEGRIALDEDVNAYLTSWRVPGGEHSAPVTVRHLLQNISGLSGYVRFGHRQTGDPSPTVLDILHGRPPARTAQVQVEFTPGTVFRRSANHYFVLQQLMSDITGESFPELMEALVFAPLGMAGSSFDPAFPETSGRPVARGHDASGAPVPEELLITPEHIVAGLWSTAPDLAAVALEIRKAYVGEQPRLLTGSLAAQMLDPYPGSYYGLSTLVDDTTRELSFGHAGEITGYRAITMTGAHGGTGLVVLTNSDSGKEVVRSMMAALGREDEHFGRGRLAENLAQDGR